MENNEQMNGECEEENAQRRDCHKPILSMTAHVIQATYDECLKCGMVGYVIILNHH